MHTLKEESRAVKVAAAWQSLTKQMLNAKAVHRIEHLVSRHHPVNVPSSAGVYAFWWMGCRELLMSANRHIILKGPGGSDVDVRYHDWWPADAPYPCLYVGKATDLKRRLREHRLPGTPGRAHPPLTQNNKAKPRTTSCQLRFGIEHVFPREADPLTLINNNIGFSWCDDFPDNAVAERFFAEDKLVGHLRPWFNIDSER
ncbi:hypothetical protein A8L59_15130 [Pseudomonas koreensis]|uniref:GIY-YIG domain-containing protein n=1 Tax=Pseudomonas koreensis TaxID=198620 RepID=A0AAC9BTU3_9PSED|nr:GIY-YIG nuclease family protein [Pseudomonas koreensis]ANH98691.1 hypothetical protein A8L59_15130 [Pseudomonas koreensis]MCM8742827.1 GIY-YIG nuclease family protein [Pseudomonas koreensis]